MFESATLEAPQGQCELGRTRELQRSCLLIAWHCCASLATRGVGITPPPDLGHHSSKVPIVPVFSMAFHKSELRRTPGLV